MSVIRDRETAKLSDITFLKEISNVPKENKKKKMSHRTVFKLPPPPPQKKRK